MAIRLGVLEHDPTSQFKAWIQIKKPAHDPHKMVCCWRAEGQEFFVSTPQPLPYLFTSAKLLPTANATEASNKIVDITAWRQWEKERFQKIGIILQNPLTLGLTGLITLCRVAVLSASIPPSFIFVQQWAIRLICSYRDSQTNDGSSCQS